MVDQKKRPDEAGKARGLAGELATRAWVHSLRSGRRLSSCRFVDARDAELVRPQRRCRSSDERRRAGARRRC